MPDNVVHIWHFPPGNENFPQGLTKCGKRPWFGAVRRHRVGRMKRTRGYGKGFRFCKHCEEKS